MANNFKISNAAANAEIAAMCALLNTGYLRIYSGVQPANADTALSGNVLLAELRFSATAFASPVAGAAAANAITADTNADATGTASWFRAFQSDGSTVVCDGSVATSGADCNLNSIAISSGATVSVSAMTLTQGKG